MHSSFWDLTNYSLFDFCCNMHVTKLECFFVYQVLLYTVESLTFYTKSAGVVILYKGAGFGEEQLGLLPLIGTLPPSFTLQFYMT